MAQHIANENKARGVETVAVIYNALLATVAWLVVYTGVPIEPTLILTSFMVMDIISGMAASWSMGEHITSVRLKRGVIEKFLTLFIPLILGLIAAALGATWDSMITTGLVILILSEAYSILSNIVRFKTGENLPEIDAVSMIAHQIRKSMSRFLGEK